MTVKRNILMTFGVVVALAVAAFLVQSCGIYSFTGTSIQPDVKTVTIPYFEYKALKVNPSLSNQLTEKLQEKFIRLTRLELVDEEGDLEVVGMVASFTYGFSVAEEAFAKAGVKLITLTNYEAVLEAAKETGYITEEVMPTLQEWRANPSEWRNDLK